MVFWDRYVGNPHWLPPIDSQLHSTKLNLVYNAETAQSEQRWIVLQSATKALLPRTNTPRMKVRRLTSQCLNSVLLASSPCAPPPPAHARSHPRTHTTDTEDASEAEEEARLEADARGGKAKWVPRLVKLALPLYATPPGDPAMWRSQTGSFLCDVYGCC